MLEFARIAIGEGDPVSCARCGTTARTSHHPLARVREAILEALSTHDDPTGPNLCLCGPEPFEHPELPQLVAACVQAGARRVALETDAAALSAAHNAHGVLSAGVHHLRVRLLETDPARGELLGVPSARTRDSLAGIGAFRDAAATASVRAVVSIVVPVCPHNLGALPDIVVQAAALHADRVRLGAMGALPPSASAMLAAACDTGMVNGVWVEVDPQLGLPETHQLHSVAEGRP